MVMMLMGFDDKQRALCSRLLEEAKCGRELTNRLPGLPLAIQCCHVSRLSGCLCVDAKPAFFIYCLACQATPARLWDYHWMRGEKANFGNRRQNIGRHMPNLLIKLAISGHSGVNEMTEMLVITTVNG